MEGRWGHEERLSEGRRNGERERREVDDCGQMEG